MEKGNLPPYRLRVEKNINKKALLLKLSFNYFFVFVGVLFASLGILLVSFSGKTLFLVIILNVISFMVIQYFDRTDILDEISSKKLPGSIDNNLYELKDENNPIINKSSDTEHRKQ
ncbi:hypothetical protein [Maribacter sp. 4G9]|uniref:hypothetical protein n=1 Tax=Maribacter sp. 4G9 TaxID=1889777 RepID=UPI000C14C638|nr:hypothetical protein [Maribacter sp. 4G9]PIB39063.1 hypothetical protein BFP75_00885 [Maribacter sp. 4G9]